VQPSLHPGPPLHPHDVPLVHGAHVTPMAPQASTTALRPLAASWLVGACRDRPTAHEGVATATTFLPSFPVRRGVSRRPPARPTTTHAALFSLPLSLSLSISFSPPVPIPATPAPSFTGHFSFFSFPLIFPPFLSFFANRRLSRGWPITSRARRPCAAIVEEYYPFARNYVIARQLVPRPVCALNTDRVNCG